MIWSDIELAFSRAFYYSLSKKQLLITFPSLLLCGILTVFCRALSCSATPWIKLCLGFLPIFLSSSVLLALGCVLSRIYYHQLKHISVNLRRLISSSMDLIIGISYLSVPSLLMYLVLWMVLGVFFLFKEIPGIGEFFSVVFSFGPFLLIFGSLSLCFLNLALLFFVAPAATTLSMRKGALARRVVDSVKTKILSSFILFLIGSIPLLIVTSLLLVSGFLTNTSFFSSENFLSISMEWFFVMIPFAALLTPAVIFFFHFSAETYLMLQRIKE